METLVIGGSGSGKSEYAELLACREEGIKYYIAAMEPYDEEMLLRIRRHQRMRSGRGFTTIERYRDLAGLTLTYAGAVLIECMSNLLANELYGDAAGRERAEDEVIADILAGTEHIKGQCSSLIIVSNDIFSSGERYEEETHRYMRLLGKINRALAARADCVVQLVYGTPVIWKAEPGPDAPDDPVGGDKEREG